MARAKTQGTRLVGFATNNNPFFRAVKFRSDGFVCGKFIALQRGPIAFDTAFTVKSDYDFTAAHLVRYGSVVINNFMYPEFRRFEVGGVGPKAARLPHAIAAVARLQKKYPGLFRVSKKPGCPPGTEVQLLPLRTEK